MFGKKVDNYWDSTVKLLYNCFGSTLLIDGWINVCKPHCHKIIIIIFQLDQSVKDLLSVGQDIDDPTSDEDIADTSEALGRIINVDVQDSFRV